MIDSLRWMGTQPWLRVIAQSHRRLMWRLSLEAAFRPIAGTHPCIAHADNVQSDRTGRSAENRRTLNVLRYRLVGYVCVAPTGRFMVGYLLSKEIVVGEQMPDLSLGDRAIILMPDQLAWRDYPGIPGAQVVALLGDPGKPQAVIMRVKIPPHRIHPPHSHPYPEIATVISGRGGFAFGDKFDKSKGEMGGVGSFGVGPANQPHFVWTENEEVVVQVQFNGPAVVNFVNPADDPRIR